MKQIDAEQDRLCVENSWISRRKAYYLLRLSETFEKLKVPDKRLQAIGWTKLRVTEPHITETILKHLIKLAETSTTRDLMEIMAGDYRETKPHCMLMYFSADQYAKFAKAFLTAGGRKAAASSLARNRPSSR